MFDKVGCKNYTKFVDSIIGANIEWQHKTHGSITSTKKISSVGWQNFFCKRILNFIQLRFHKIFLKQENFLGKRRPLKINNAPKICFHHKSTSN